jgi:5-methylthioribose kinase
VHRRDGAQDAPAAEARLIAVPELDRLVTPDRCPRRGDRAAGVPGSQLDGDLDRRPAARVEHLARRDAADPPAIPHSVYCKQITTPPTFTLSALSAVPYLHSRGLLPPEADASAVELGGGVSNVVVRVGWDRDCLVLKQALPRLRVAERWDFDPSRTRVEHDCLRALATLLPPKHVPALRFYDDESGVLGMSCVPPGGREWKRDLLAGRIEPSAPTSAGRLLAAIQNASVLDPALPHLFESQLVLLQGRIDPFHRTAAARNPDVAAAIGAEVERTLAQRRALALGDFSPKNIFVYPEHALILDLETAHWGDPAFDPAFCLTHLVLKAMSFRERAGAYLDAASTFWRAYLTEIGPWVADKEEIERNVVAELGCVLLARIDGKSPAEYVPEEVREAVRRRAREILLDPGEPLAEILSRAT